MLARGTVVLAALSLLAACSAPGGLQHRLEVVVPADVRTVERGRLVARLFAYDPVLAGAPADVLDQQEIAFSHQVGTQTLILVTLAGTVPRGYESYLKASGYEAAGEGWATILWDGQTGTGLPGRVVMRPVAEGP